MDPSYNNSFDSFGANSGQLNGGVVLSGVQPAKKSKKRWLIGIVLLVIIVLVAMIIVVLLPKKKEGSSDIKEKYLNLVVSGDEKGNSDYKIGEKIYFSSFYYDSEDAEWSEYYNKLADLLSGMENSGGDMAGAATTQKQLLKVLNLDKTMDNSEFYIMLDKYVEGGEVAMSSYVNSEISSLEKSNSGYVTEYHDKIGTIMMLIFDYIDIVSEVGCDGYSIETVGECVKSDEEKIRISSVLEQAFLKSGEIDEEIPYVLAQYIQGVEEMANPLEKGES